MLQIISPLPHCVCCKNTSVSFHFTAVISFQPLIVKLSDAVKMLQSLSFKLFASLVLKVLKHCKNALICFHFTSVIWTIWSTKWLTVVSNSDGLAAEGLVVSGELLLRLGRVCRPEHDPGGRVAYAVSVDSLHEHLNQFFSMFIKEVILS